MTTKDDIQANINSRLNSLPTLIEGGTIQDIIGSVSYELANILDTQIEPILKNAFISTQDIEYLTIRGNELGITRKEPSYSFVKATVTNAESNILIDTEVCAKTESGLIFQNIKETRTDENGCAVITMQCNESGSIGNINIGELNEFYETYTGLQEAEITNEENGYFGYDEESVEDYRARILEFVREEACNSNMADYKMWAKSVNGVKDAIVEDAKTAGAGHVNVYISAINNGLVTNELISTVKTYIEKNQIINAKVNVYAVQYSTVDISAKLELEDGFDIEAIENEFRTKVEEYFMTTNNVISYFGISNLFFEITGVKDVSDYLLCNGTINVEIEETNIPVLGSVELTV